MKHKVLYLIISQGGIDSEYRSIEWARKRVRLLEARGIFAYLKEISIASRGLVQISTSIHRFR